MTVFVFTDLIFNSGGGGGGGWLLRLWGVDFYFTSVCDLYRLWRKLILYLEGCALFHGHAIGVECLNYVRS